MAFGANGTRYDERCRRCRHVTEVCNDCECCLSHCSCEQDAADQREVEKMHRQHPGVLDALTRHREQGAAEQD